MKSCSGVLSFERYPSYKSNMNALATYLPKSSWKMIKAKRHCATMFMNVILMHHYKRWGGQCICKGTSETRWFSQPTIEISSLAWVSKEQSSQEPGDSVIAAAMGTDENQSKTWWQDPIDCGMTEHFYDHTMTEMPVASSLNSNLWFSLCSYFIV